MKKYILFLLFISLLNISKAQYFQTGEDPASIRWRQINTENFQLIYPDYFEDKASNLVMVLEKVYNVGGASLNHKPKKISIILHTQSVKSNGLVAWAPKRSEFYTTPNQAIYPQDWLQQLAVHEFRHVVQIDKINSELPKIIKILLGEQGAALVFGAYLPWWFIEGDAVVTETALSNFGRGRFPSFLMEHKAQVVENGVYKYDKAYNGSANDYVPSHYQLGYYLIGAAREKYGIHLWDSVLTSVGKNPFSLNPFNKALKIKTGFNKVQLYNSVFDSLKNVWMAEDKNYQTMECINISQPNKTYTNYKYSHWLNDSTIVSYKTTLNKIPAFVLIEKNGKERKLFNPGIIFKESVNFNDDWLVYAEQVPGLRWSHSGSSLIKLYNLKSSKKTKFTTEYKAFAPAISPSQESVVVVESDFSSNYFLSVYRIEDGKLLHRIQTKDNHFFFSPEWLNDKELVAIILGNKGKRLAKINIQSGKMEILYQKELGELRSLNVKNNKLYFVSSYSGKNSIFCMNLNDNSIAQIFEPRFGGDYPAISPNNKKMLFSNYTANGFQLLEIPINEEKHKKIIQVSKGDYHLAEQLAKQEPGVINFEFSDSVKYQSEKYNKTAHLFNLHSWAPVSVDINSYEFAPGVSFMSQNKLGTSETIFGYEWDIAEKTGKVYGKYTYKGWYPIFDFEISTGKRASEYMLVEQTNNNAGELVRQDTLLKRFTWKETRLGIDTRIPFNLSRGKYNRLLQPEIKYDLTFCGHDNSTPEQFFEGNFQSLNYRIYYQQLLKQSSQDVFPNFGFVADASFRHSPVGNIKLGTMFLGQTILFIPGIMANHGIRLYGGYQDKKLEGSHSFSDAIHYPRGWGKINTTEVYSFTSDYKLPLFYPEWSVGGLVYIQRINASLFADYAFLKGNYYKNGYISGTFTSNISSYGVELTGDVNFLRFYAPVNIGTRVSYLPEVNGVYFDLLLSINFNSL